MKVRVLFVSLLLSVVFAGGIAFSDTGRAVMNLNGRWEFEQTETAFPPERFTRSIPVPGLIDSAEPKIEQYQKYFSGTHQPRYNWYRYKFAADEQHRDKFAVLNLLKSRFDTQVILNGHDLGTYMQCNTPIECNLTSFISYGDENILLIRVGERAWLPKQSATGVDREKYTDIPGVWDDVFITFTGPVRVERSLILPDLKNSKVTAKILIENHGKMLDRSMYLAETTGTVSVYVREKKGGRKVTDEVSQEFSLRSQNHTPVVLELPLEKAHPWSPEDPFLYEAVVSVSVDRVWRYHKQDKNMDPVIHRYPASQRLSDVVATSFGMRDFESVGRMFHLNGKQYRILGSTINLFRFFEDPERAGLPWDRQWVKKMFIDIPKALRWNGFRMCIGLAPKFWYELADEHGILIQNEWPMWQVRGWDEQIDKEYTDWVWADGSSPSIIIWDAMNEAVHVHISDVVIPKLRKLDPTRIWDAGFMTADRKVKNEMEEPHYYPFGHGWWVRDEGLRRERLSYRFGNLFRKHAWLGRTRYGGSPMVLNEYGWLWLNRDGVPGIRTKGYFGPKDTPPKRKNYEYYNPDGVQEHFDRCNYDYLLGSNPTVEQRRDVQAYLMELQTEAIRSSRNLAGILSFCYLADNRGYTGDWFIDAIKDLVPSDALKCQYHCFAPFAVFIDVEDGRYQKDSKPFRPGAMEAINLFAVNDSGEKRSGTVVLKIIDVTGRVVFSKSAPVAVDAFWEKLIPMTVEIPDKPGGYLMVSELEDNQPQAVNQQSRRYIRVGDVKDVAWPEYKIELPPAWPK